jgi:hypothetical protein
MISNRQDAKDAKKNVFSCVFLGALGVLAVKEFIF